MKTPKTVNRVVNGPNQDEEQWERVVNGPGKGDEKWDRVVNGPIENDEDENKERAT